MINDNGGTKQAGDINVSFVHAGNPSPASFPGDEAGTTVTMDAGSYELSTDDPGPGYFGFSSDPGCSPGPIANGETKHCTINFDDKPGTLEVDKVVVNDNGGTNKATDFKFSVNNGSSVAFDAGADDQHGSKSVTVDAGTYTVSEDAAPGYTPDYDNCTGVHVDNGQTATCTITNDDQPGTLIVKKVVVGGTRHATDFSFKVDNGSSVTFIQDGDQLHGKNTLTVDAGSHSVLEDTMSGYAAMYTNDQNANTNCNGLTVGNGQTVTCTITNTVTDDDGDGIPNNVDCNPLKDNLVVDPNNVTLLPPAKRFNYLKDAVAAAQENYVISMYANTTENVVINNGKDLLIEGCGHKIAAANSSNPTIDVQAGAGANDGNTGAGEADIQIQNLTVMGGSAGINVATVKTAGKWTLLKGFRADNNTVGVWITGSGNEVSGANSISSNGQVGVKVTGSGNSVHDSRIYSNGQQGIYGTSSNGNFSKNKVGDAGQGNGLAGSGYDGVYIKGDSNTIKENDVFSSGGSGIVVVGNTNTVNKNDVGDKGKGNGRDGISINGNNNTAGSSLNENDVFANGQDGFDVVGNNNVLSKNAAGDKGKQNGRDGFNVSGNGNKLTENTAYANGRDGFDIAGGMAAYPNVLLKNVGGDDGKGNGRNGFSLANVGNGTGNPIELEQNTAQGNVADGINVAGAGWQLKNNSSGGSSGQKNGGCAFKVVAGNFNAQGNKANNNLIPGALNSAFPSGCTG